MLAEVPGLATSHLAFEPSPGGVAERLNAAVSKTVVRLIGVPGVRISPPPFSPGVWSLFELPA